MKLNLTYDEVIRIFVGLVILAVILVVVGIALLYI